MAWYFVKQPNGLLARFSEIPDFFTDIDLTVEHALLMCMKEYGMSKESAALKVQRALDDEDQWERNKKGDGSLRWSNALKTIVSVHGKKSWKAFLKNTTFPKIFSIAYLTNIPNNQN